MAELGSRHLRIEVLVLDLEREEVHRIAQLEVQRMPVGVGELRRPVGRLVELRKAAAVGGTKLCSQVVVQNIGCERMLGHTGQEVVVPIVAEVERCRLAVAHKRLGQVVERQSSPGQEEVHRSRSVQEEVLPSHLVVAA